MLVHLFIVYFISMSVFQLVLIKKYSSRGEENSNYDKIIMLIRENSLPGKLMLFSYISEILFAVLLIVHLLLSY